MSDRSVRPCDPENEHCWCEPGVYQICPICSGDRCGYCDETGWVDEYDDEQPLVIIHHCPKCGSKGKVGCQCR